jgi:hypothetical protein
MRTTARAHRTTNRQQHQAMQMIADRIGREQQSLAIIFRGIRRRSPNRTRDVWGPEI